MSYYLQFTPEGVVVRQKSVERCDPVVATLTADDVLRLKRLVGERRPPEPAPQPPPSGVVPGLADATDEDMLVYCEAYNRNGHRAALNAVFAHRRATCGAALDSLADPTEEEAGRAYERWRDWSGTNRESIRHALTEFVRDRRNSIAKQT